MTEHARDAEAIFLAALDKATPQERAAYVEAECEGNSELLRRVRELVGCHEGTQGPLDARPPGLRCTVDMPATSEQPGTVIGPYKLLQQIGEGGMGTVYMAEQTRPVQRKVALKVIKAGMDTRQVIARFEAERQALAMMDHVNIARVLDAGATDSGRPYFVMELVHGVPITKYCDDNHMTPRERLELFVPVCQAIQHAHQKGIIHRDIKPSNVMVTLYDGKPVPKVIDFGVAKATEQTLTERTLFTQFGTMVGTLEYMSPEQAEMSAVGVDTRSDIYSLGVLLYELLTGSTPLSHKRVREAAQAEILRMIKEEEPPRPSTRLSDSGEALASISAQRHMEPAKLTKLVRGELDWIVMKTLEKDRNRRYETASAFAADVQRYLNDETVDACPPSAAYRVRKLIRRNRGPVLAASLVLLALVGGVIGTTIGLVRAEQARNDAVAAKEVEAEQRRSAEEERAVARAVIDFLQQDLLRQADGWVQADRGFTADPNLTVKEALHRAAAHIGDRFQDQPLVEAAIRQAIGEAYMGVGELQLAPSHFERALALRRQKLGAEHILTLTSMHGLGLVYLNVVRTADALAIFEETVKLRRAKLGPDHRDTLHSQLFLATSYRESGRLVEAVSLHEATLKVAEASLGRDDILTLRCRMYLAMAYVLAHQFAEGLALEEEVLKLSKATKGPHHPATLVIRGDLGWCYELAGRFPEAISLNEETLDLMKELMGPAHSHTIAVTWSLARSLRAAGRPKEAVALLEGALKVSQAQLGPRDLHTANTLAELAGVQMDLGRYDLAEPLLRPSLAVLEEGWPDDWGTFGRKSLYGRALLGQKKYADAEPLLLKGYRGLKERATTISPNRHRTLTDALEPLVRLYDAWGKPDEEAKWRKELEAHRKAEEKTGKPMDK